MFTKLLLLIIISIICLLVGYRLRQKLVIRRELIVEYKAFIEYLMNQTIYHKTPIIASVEGYKKYECNSIIDFDYIVQSIGEFGTEQGWKRWLDKLLEQNIVEDTCINLFSEPSNFLGLSSADHQKVHFAALIDGLNKEINRCNAIVKEKGDNYIKVSLYIGLIIGLIII